MQDALVSFGIELPGAVLPCSSARGSSCSLSMRMCRPVSDRPDRHRRLQAYERYRVGFARVCLTVPLVPGAPARRAYSLSLDEGMPQATTCLLAGTRKLTIPRKCNCHCVVPYWRWHRTLHASAPVQGPYVTSHTLCKTKAWRSNQTWRSDRLVQCLATASDCQNSSVPSVGGCEQLASRAPSHEDPP